jgi:predicted HTH transcriptional regulator
MSPDYLARLFQQRSQARMIWFDEQTVGAATLEDLSAPLWRRFLTNRAAAEQPETALDKLAMARRDDRGIWRPTVAGILMACPTPRRFLPNAYVQAVAYLGEAEVPPADAAAYQLDAADLDGTLDEQIIDGCRFVLRNMKTAAFKSVGRSDLPQYDITAVFEALVNAVAHRDYAIYGSRIRLRMYSNRLELFSPGALANTMTVDSLPLRQSSRNEAITSLLARCPVPDNLPGLRTQRSAMMDRRGEGVPIILDRSQALSRRTPEYEVIDGEELRLTIWAADPFTVRPSN